MVVMIAGVSAWRLEQRSRVARVRPR
jgi:hypothetical protein